MKFIDRCFISTNIVLYRQTLFSKSYR